MIAGSRNFLRNAWLSTAATAVMTVTLVIILISFVLSSALQTSVKTVLNRIDVSIFLADSVTPEQAIDMQKQLQQVENVQEVKYVNKEEALEKFKRQNRNNKRILDTIRDNSISLQASIEVKTKNPANLAPVADFVNRPEIKPMVSKFSYEDDRKILIDRVVRVSNFIRTAGLVMSLLFVVISVLIIFNTIRMAIYTRRGEIEIMKLVGATNWFIRGPFLFEACLYGIIAAAIAVGICYTLLLAGASRLTSFIDVNSTIGFFRSYPALIVLTELMIGMAIGVISSLLAMGRYLKL